MSHATCTQTQYTFMPSWVSFGVVIKWVGWLVFGLQIERHILYFSTDVHFAFPTVMQFLVRFQDNLYVANCKHFEYFEKVLYTYEGSGNCHD